ncbi:MAG: class I SAM-dependent methyltransferase, partial [Flavobacterium sp.]
MAQKYYLKGGNKTPADGFFGRCAARRAVRTRFFACCAAKRAHTMLPSLTHPFKETLFTVLGTRPNMLTKNKKAPQGAVAATGLNPKINFEQADVTQYELEACDGVIISDVLHYLLPERQEALLDKCFQALEPGGLLIVRDGVAELAERHEGTKRTEVLSTRIFNFNKT